MRGNLLDPSTMARVIRSNVANDGVAMADSSSILHDEFTNDYANGLRSSFCSFECEMISSVTATCCTVPGAVDVLAVAVDFDE